MGCDGVEPPGELSGELSGELWRGREREYDTPLLCGINGRTSVDERCFFPLGEASTKRVPKNVHPRANIHPRATALARMTVGHPPVRITVRPTTSPSAAASPPAGMPAIMLGFRTRPRRDTAHGATTRRDHVRWSGTRRSDRRISTTAMKAREKGPFIWLTA